MEGTKAGTGTVAGAYGSALAGGFDFSNFIRQPQTIVRLLSGLFAIVVFACITTEGYINPVHSAQVKCIFNQNDSACQFSVAVGVLGFLACIAFLLLDVYVPFMSNVQERKYAFTVDLGFSGVWTFLWFVCFCLLASEWSFTRDVSSIPEDAARATIAFSFFSIATWGILTYFAVGRYCRSINEVSILTYAQAPPAPPTALDHNIPYPPTYAPTTYTPTTFTPYPSSLPDMSQQTLYTTNVQPQSDYQPPNY